MKTALTTTNRITQKYRNISEKENTKTKFADFTSIYKPSRLKRSYVYSSSKSRSIIETKNQQQGMKMNFLH